MPILFNLAKIAVHSLVVILTDTDGNIIDAASDGNGGPILTTQDQDVFDTIADAIYDIW